MESLLDTLRHETTEIHQTLHKNPILKACQEGTINKRQYIHLLKAFHQPWAILSPAIQAVPIVSLRPKLHLRIQAIQTDLKQLNIHENGATLTAQQDVYTESKLLGMCYVLIGSSMGASILSKNVTTSLSDVPVSYLSMTPKEAGWPELVTTLRNLDSSKYAAASTAAIDTFKLIHTNLKAFSENIDCKI